MSIQFDIVEQDFNDDRSERYLRALRLWEFGPVTFPANRGASAALHSLSELVVDLGEHAASEAGETLESGQNADGADPPSEPDRDSIRLSDDRLTLILTMAEAVERHETRALADTARLDRLKG